VYISMNRFQIHSGREKAFEKVWSERDSYLDEVAGFREFYLLRGETTDGITPYVSHTLWDSQAAFQDWTDSESFRKAHSQARTPEGTVAGPPVFEGYEIVL